MAVHEPAQSESRTTALTIAEPDAAPSTAAIAGHPIHPMLVPVPIGLYVGAVAADIVQLAGGGRFWSSAARWLLRGGLVSGAAAGMVGTVDFVTVARARRPEGWIHMVGNVSVLGLTLVNLALRRDRRRAPLTAIALTLLSGAMLGLTGWMGGELAYRHRVGVTRSSIR